MDNILEMLVYSSILYDLKNIYKLFLCVRFKKNMFIIISAIFRKNYELQILLHAKYISTYKSESKDVFVRSPSYICLYRFIDI